MSTINKISKEEKSKSKYIQDHFYEDKSGNVWICGHNEVGEFKLVNILDGSVVDTNNFADDELVLIKDGERFTVEVKYDR